MQRLAHSDKNLNDSVMIKPHEKAVASILRPAVSAWHHQ